MQAEGRLDLWQIAIKPGKPLAFGAVRRGDGSTAWFIGLPGNPVSSFVTFLLAVRPVLLRAAGRDATLAPRAVPLRADFDWPQPDQRREFLRVRRNADGGLELFPNQSSGVLTSAVWADGLVDNPPGRPIRARRHRALPAVRRAAAHEDPGALLRLAARGARRRRDGRAADRRHASARCATR